MLDSTFSTILFTLLKIICWAINRLTQLFEVFSGVTKVSYRGEATFLFDIFLNHSTINNIYWGMAVIGIVLCFAFAIASVIRKIFDLNGKQEMTIGRIVGEALKSIFIILGMNLILLAALTATDVLMRQVNYLFVNSEGLTRKEAVEFTDDQYSAMGRALSTIANYGMNPSFNSRYNMNDCFNTIRQDLIYLEEQGVFDYNYSNEEGNSWQSVLQEVAHSADLRYELKGDVYYETVTDALQNALTVMRSDASFRPLEHYEEVRTTNAADIPLDRIVFLVGTLDSANNSFFNDKPSFTDALRLPYYTGEKSLYDTEDTESIKVINKDFNLSPSRFDYLVSFVLGVAVLYNTFVIILALIARMFNILFLYIIAPPVLAVRPLDGGGKSRQWMNAFIIQLLGVFGSIVVMRLLLIFVPIIFSPELVLFSGNSALNYFAKVVMLIAAYAVAKKAGSLLSGILSDTAAMQSMQAGDMSSSAQRVTGAAQRAAGTALRTVGGAVGSVVSFAASPLTNRLNKSFDSYRRLGSGASDSDLKRQAQERIAVERMMGQMRGGSDKGSGGSGPNTPRPSEKQGEKKPEPPANNRPQKDLAGSGQPGQKQNPAPPVNNRPQKDLAGSGQPDQKQNPAPKLPGEKSHGEQKRESYSSERGSFGGDGGSEEEPWNRSWAEDFRDVDAFDEETDSFDLPDSFGGGRMSDFGDSLRNDPFGDVGERPGTDAAFGGERMSDFDDSLQNDPLGNLRERPMTDTASDLRTNSRGAGEGSAAPGGNTQPPRQTGNHAPGTTQTRPQSMSGSGTNRSQSGNTQPPRQTGNHAPGTTQTRPQSMSGSGTNRSQSGNTQPPRQTGNSAPGTTQTRLQNMSGSGTNRPQSGSTQPPRQTGNTMPGSGQPGRKQNPEPNLTGEKSLGEQKRESYSSDFGAFGGDGGSEEEPWNRSWAEDFRDMDAFDEGPDSFDLPDSFGGERMSDFGDSLRNDPFGDVGERPMTDTVFAGETASDFTGSLQNDPFGDLRGRPTAETVPGLRTDSRNTGARMDPPGGSTQPPRQSGNTQPPRQSGSTQPPQQSGSTQPPRQTGNHAPGTTQTRPQNMSGSGTNRSQSGSTQPPQQSGSTQPPRQSGVPESARQRNTSGRGASVTDYLRRTYRELNKDKGEPNS